MKYQLLTAFIVSASSFLPFTVADHSFLLRNQCSYSITPVVADTACGYSPRCDGAGHYTAAQPPTIGAGQSINVDIPDDWVGRIFAQNGSCGPKGEDCTLTEYNLDTGDFYTPQAYDISNIQGFTQSISLGAAGCDTVTCTNANCGCSNAYPVGDTSGCGNDSPVRACGAGDISFTVVFCP